MPQTSIEIVQPPSGLDAGGLTTRDLTFQDFRERINPFLVVSLFDMTGPVFPPHPHGGFSVATYIFPESEIGFWNQDTIGNRNQIPPGAIHWTVAGSGLMHEETVARSGRHSFGFQIWIDHPADKRQIAPEAVHLAARDTPIVKSAGVEKRVLAGSSGGVSSPLGIPVPVHIVDLSMEAASQTEEDLTGAGKVFVWVRGGTVEIESRQVAAGEVAFIDGSSLVVRAVSAARLTMFAAQPILQHIEPGGPFVGSSAEEVASFHQRYRRGEMGRLRPFDQAALDHAFDNME